MSKYNIPWGTWAIAEKDWNFIRDTIRGQGIKTVLEFGTGLSTLLISELAEVDTFETDRGWASMIKAKVPGSRKVKFYIWNGQDPPGTEWKRKRYDLAFVDGPAGKHVGGVGREMSMKIAAKFADRIIVHDAGRKDEKELQDRILSSKFNFISESDGHWTKCNYWERRPYTTHI